MKTRKYGSDFLKALGSGAKRAYKGFEAQEHQRNMIMENEGQRRRGYKSYGDIPGKKKRG